MLILHPNSELSGLPNAPGIYGIPVPVPSIESRTHEPRARPRGLILRMNEYGGRRWGVPRLRPGPESRTVILSSGLVIHGTES